MSINFPMNALETAKSSKPFKDQINLSKETVSKSHLPTSTGEKQISDLTEASESEKLIEKTLMSVSELTGFIQSMQLTNFQPKECIHLISHEVYNLAKESTMKEVRLRKRSDNNSNPRITPFTYNLQKNPINGAIKIHLYACNENKSLLGKGAYKKVKKALSVTIDPETLNVKAVSSVIQRVLKEHDNQGQELIDAGLRNQKEILERFPGIKVAPLPIKRTYTSKSSKERCEFEQDWFNGDLHVVMKKQLLPLLMFNNSEEKRIDYVEKLDILSDVAKSLQMMHEIGFVHRDIKPRNILVRIEPEKKCEGYISDFDLIQKIGTGMIRDYCYWDRCSREGIVLPSTDLYGLVLTTAALFLPKLPIITKHKPDCQFDELKMATYLEKTITLKIINSISPKLMLEPNNPDAIICKLLDSCAHTTQLQTPIDVFEHFDGCIKKFYKENKLSDNATQFIKNSLKDLTVMHFILQLIQETIDRSDKLYQHVKKKFISKDNSNHNNGSFADWIHDDLLKNDPTLYPSAESFLKTLQLLRDIFEADIQIH